MDTNTTINAAETALQNLINEAIETGRANAGEIEARVYGGRVRLFINGARANKAQVLETLAEDVVETVVEVAKVVAEIETGNDIRHAQNLFDNERARTLFVQDVEAVMAEARNGITAWSLHKVMTTVFGWVGFEQRSPELSANCFNKLSQETGLLRYVPIQRGARTVYVAELA